jgi:hypothetical protein
VHPTPVGEGETAADMMCLDCWRSLTADSVSSWRRGHRRTRLRCCRHQAAKNQAAPPSFPKLWFIITTRAINAPLDLVCCPASSGQQPHPAAITLSGNAPTIICASAVLPRTRPQHAWRSRAPGWQPHSAAIIFCGNSPTITNLRQRAVLHYACVTVIGEAEKVTHSIHCRNPLSPQGASRAPST